LQVDEVGGEGEDVGAVDAEVLCDEFEEVGVVEEAAGAVFSEDAGMEVSFRCFEVPFWSLMESWMRPYGGCGLSFSNPCRLGLHSKSASLHVCLSTASPECAHQLDP